MTTNHLTTVAALPSGGGQAANPAPERSESEGPMVYAPSVGRLIPLPAHPLFKAEEVADRHGFEPFEYTERN